MAYELEYGMAEVEIEKCLINKGDKVVIVDDLLATGGTTNAIAKIVEKWIALYATERSLTGIEESDMENVKNIFYDIEFFKYTGYAYYEYIDAFITKIDYYRKHSIGKSV